MHMHGVSRMGACMLHAWGNPDHNRFRVRSRFGSVRFGSGSVSVSGLHNPELNYMLSHMNYEYACLD